MSITACPSQQAAALHGQCQLPLLQLVPVHVMLHMLQTVLLLTPASCCGGGGYCCCAADDDDNDPHLAC
jgi:hypothetical protein